MSDERDSAASEDEQEYMTTAHIAEYLDLSETSVRNYQKNETLPGPDLVHHGINLWLQKTIDDWYEKRVAAHKFGRKPRPRAVSARTVRPSAITTWKRTPDSPQKPPPPPDAAALAEALAVAPEPPAPPTNVELPAAMEVALQLRADGWFVLSADVVRLAASSAGALGWEEQQLRARVMERLRALEPVA